MTGVNTTKQQMGEIKNTIQSLEAATEMFWGKRCSYKQLFWKLPGEIFSQNPWKISLKKIVSSKVAHSRYRKFLPKKETGEKHNFQKYLY